MVFQGYLVRKDRKVTLGCQGKMVSKDPQAPQGMEVSQAHRVSRGHRDQGEKKGYGDRQGPLVLQVWSTSTTKREP